MKIKINVKEEHIINGKCARVNECAIALAVNDIIPDVMVAREQLGLAYPDATTSILCDLPTFVTSNIWLFDQLDKVIGKERLEHLSPFSFEVDIDEAILFPDKLLQEIEQIIEGSKNIELVAIKK